MMTCQTISSDAMVREEMVKQRWRAEAGEDPLESRRDPEDGVTDFWWKIENSQMLVTRSIERLAVGDFFSWF